MKNFFYLSLIISTVLFISCKKDNEEINTQEEQSTTTLNIVGKAQKGPIIKGSTVIINELNSELTQTGKSFTSTTNSDAGNFEINNINLSSNIILSTVTGYYYSEIYGTLSPSVLTLQSYSKVSSNKNVNINVMTNIIKDRIHNLVISGKNFDEAKQQAENEFLNFMGVDDIDNINFEELDISDSTNPNAVLLAFSLIVQRNTPFLDQQQTMTAELSQLLTNITSDFADDGIISNQSIIDTLLHNISQLNYIDIENNIRNRYNEIGQTVEIPNYKKYIQKFSIKYNTPVYTEIYYPDSASPSPLFSQDKIKNILPLNDTVFSQGAYSIAAIIPYGSTLKIEIIPDSGSFSLGGPVSGWEVINNYPNGFTLNSQRENQLMTLLFQLDAQPGQSAATIKYYINESNTPSYIKHITWNY